MRSRPIKTMLAVAVQPKIKLKTTHCLGCGKSITVPYGTYYCPETSGMCKKKGEEAAKLRDTSVASRAQGRGITRVQHKTLSIID